MQSPEERKAYTDWYRKQYADHIKFQRRVRALRKQGVKNPEQAVFEEQRQKRDFEARLELEKEFEWLRIGRLQIEKKQKAEKAKAKAEAKAREKAKKKEAARRLKQSEDYVAMLIALEEGQKKIPSPAPEGAKEE